MEWIREKYVAIIAELDERGRRRWAGAEARSLGWGGIAAVAEATGISDRTIRTGIQELDDPNAAPSKQRPAISRGVPLETHEIVVDLMARQKPKRAWKFTLGWTQANTKNQRKSATIDWPKYESSATHSTESGMTKSYPATD